MKKKKLRILCNKRKEGNSTVNIDFYYETVNHVGVRLYVSLM